MAKTKNYLEFEYTIQVPKCPCGSNKAPAKCCGPIKPRTHAVLLDRRNYTESDGLAIGLDYSLKRIVDGQILPLIGTPVFVQTHKRAHKQPKVLLRGETDGAFVMDPNSVLSRFEEYFVIDTNTRQLHGRRISISAVLHAHLKGDWVMWTPVTAFEFWEPQIDPEILGWYTLIRAIEEGGIFSDSRIGVIVDSHLDDLDKLNRRETELHGNQYLPERMKLVYASADKAGSVVNFLIRQADKLARAQLDRVAKSAEMDTLNKGAYPCQFFRQWFP